MKDLLEIRNEIDAIDRQIVNLYEKRMELTTQVAAYKIENGKAVFDKEREKQKLSAVCEMAHSDFTAHGVRELFEHLMAMSRKKQYQLLTEYGQDFETLLTEVEQIPQSAEQTILVAYDAMEEYKTLFGTRPSIRYNGDVESLLCKLSERAEDYAFFKIGAAHRSADAIDYYNQIAEAGLYILHEYRAGADEGMRYLLVGTEPITLAGADKITVCFEASDECGSLYHLLSHLTYNGRNLNRIGSVMISSEPLDYRFFLDLSGNLRDDSILNALRGLSDESRNFRILGNYK